MTLARDCLETVRIDDRYMTMLVADQTIILQNPGGDGDTGTLNSQASLIEIRG